MKPVNKKGIHINNLKLLRANYYTHSGGINLFAPNIEISDSYTIISGVDRHNVHTTLKIASEDLNLVGVSIAFAGVYNQVNYGKPSYGNEKILSDKYRIETANSTAYLTLFYENPSVSSEYTKEKPVQSTDSIFSGLEEAIVESFEEALSKRKEAVNDYNSFVNRNVNRPNISNELKNEVPKNTINNSFEALKEFFMNNKDEIKKILDIK